LTRKDQDILQIQSLAIDSQNPFFSQVETIALALIDTLGSQYISEQRCETQADKPLFP
jgi:hypothetical protein